MRFRRQFFNSSLSILTFKEFFFFGQLIILYRHYYFGEKLKISKTTIYKKKIGLKFNGKNTKYKIEAKIKQKF